MRGKTAKMLRKLAFGRRCEKTRDHKEWEGVYRNNEDRGEVCHGQAMATTYFWKPESRMARYRHLKGIWTVSGVQEKAAHMRALSMAGVRKMEERPSLLSKWRKDHV